ncbi:hypothetical protein D5041_21405 (plasmid) [Verminephrobacter aporrectodeae subsp. tuberculatae]|nr:hypothetical protein [Verminephrobacter aporrectodeae subsp. tuberculatae]MCW5291482.1 hypothetical protein [Verminephrobacter aporrectodeae subsp. tuberculatae]
MAVGAALSCTVLAAPPATTPAAPASTVVQVQPTQATKARTTATSVTPQAVAMKQHVDRMSILLQERTDILAKLKKLEENGDKPALTRILDDLQSIDREIVLVSRQPVYQTSSAAPNQATSTKFASVAKTADPESQPSESEKVTYEGWDIFKNFGRKGN